MKNRHFMRLIAYTRVLLSVAMLSTYKSYADEVDKVRAFDFHVKRVIGIVFDGDSSSFVSGSVDGTVAWWKTSAAKPEKTVVFDDKIIGFSHVANARLLGVTTTKGVEVWNANDATQLSSKEIEASHAVFFGERNNLLIVLRSRGVKVLDWKTGEFTSEFEPVDLGNEFPGVYSTVTVSRDSKTAVLTYNNTLILYDLESGKQTQRIDSEVPFLRGYSNFRTQDHFCSSGYSPDGKKFAAANDSGYIRVWSTASWEALYTVDCGHSVHAIAFSPDSQTIAVAYRGLQVVNVATGKLVELVDAFDSREHYNSVAFSLSGENIAVGGSHGSIKVLTIKKR